MANIDKQHVAVINLNQIDTYILNYNKDWNKEIEKIWGKEKVIRKTFTIYDGGILECSPKIAKEIENKFYQYIKENYINTSKIQKVNISINNNNINIEIDAPSLTKMERAITSIKKWFKDYK